jgi:hypothetical protein
MTQRRVPRFALAGALVTAVALHGLGCNHPAVKGEPTPDAAQPEQNPEPFRPLEVACTDELSLVRMSDGTLRGWGTNRDGALGLGARGGDVASPVQLHELRDVVQLARWEQRARSDCMCAVARRRGEVLGIPPIQSRTTRGVRRCFSTYDSPMTRAPTAGRLHQAIWRSDRTRSAPELDSKRSRRWRAGRAAPFRAACGSWAMSRGRLRLRG